MLKTNVMIFVAGFGQMSNNIIQFGHYYAWGKENGVKVIALRFCYKYTYFNICKKLAYNWLTYISAKYLAKAKLIRTVEFLEEKEVNEPNKELLRTKKWVLVKGWLLRDYDLFIKYKDEIKSLFSFKKKIETGIDAFMKSIIREEDINLGVHIRRGDYIRWENGNYFFNDEFYIDLIKQFLLLFPDKKVNIFISTNDKTLNIELYREKLSNRVFIRNGNPAEDLCMLSKCNYLIGPPSTFSLMASFYRDLPLYWIKPKDNVIAKDSFQYFDYLFRHII